MVNFWSKFKTLINSFKEIKSSNKGFSLIELLIGLAIFGAASGILTGIFLTITQSSQVESASIEVASQLNFVNQAIGRLISESSNVEIEPGEDVSVLKLRMQEQAKDPTIISLTNNAITLKEGSSEETYLTNDKVVVNLLNFKRSVQYPGHDTVAINLMMTYNSENPRTQISRTIQSAIARASAATFDSNIVPGGTSNLTLGQVGSPWQRVVAGNGTASIPSYTFSGATMGNTGVGLFSPATNVLGFATDSTERVRIDNYGQVGIGTNAPAARLNVAGAEDVSLVNNGFFVLGFSNGYNIAMNHNEIQARNNGTASPLYLQNDGGGVYALAPLIIRNEENSDVVYGGNYIQARGLNSVPSVLYLQPDESADSYLQLPGQGDVSLVNNGKLVIGNTDARNIAIDSNEIQARNNGVASELYLNQEGGTIYGQGYPFAGARAFVRFGYNAGQVIVKKSFNVTSVTRLGTGQYVVNLAVDAPDANYICVGGGRAIADVGGSEASPNISFSNWEVGSFRVGTQDNNSDSYRDVTDLMVAVFW